MKWIALFIAIGSIIAGLVLGHWPQPPCSGSLLCLSGLSEAITGGYTVFSGIIILILILIVSWRRRILSVIALVLLGGIAVWIQFQTSFGIYEPIKIILVMGLIFAGLSANPIPKKKTI